MAFRFRVDTNNIYVYTRAYSIENSNVCGILRKNEEFISHNYANNNDETWQEITQCNNHPEFVGKCIFKRMLTSGYNIKKLAKSQGTDTTPSTDTPAVDTNLTGVMGAPVYNTNAVSTSTGAPVSRTYDGTVVQQEEPIGTYIEDTFLEEYTPNLSIEEYNNQLQSGLTIDNLRGVLGIPHQFLPTTDIRLDDADNMGGNQDNIGRVFAERILKNMPILLLTPGIPSFMSQFSNAQKTNLLTSLLSNVSDTFKGQLLNSYSGKYYTLKFAYVEYFKYVNAMLRSAAVFLGIDKEEIVPNKRLGSFNWLYDNDGNNSDNNGISRFLGPYAGCVAFYADCGTSVSDSFSNSTTQSQLASSLNSLSDTGRELNFLVGNVGSLAGLKVNALTGEEGLEQNMANMQDVINSVLGGGNIMSNILNKAQTILAGGRLIFPEIWSDSSFSRSYSCSMKLVARTGDPLCVYLDELVPLYHLIGMCWPRQSIQQSYFSPFLIRGYYKGQFNIDMAIMTDLSITKGTEGEWTKDGLPTVMEINFSLKDMYEGIMMSKADSPGDMNIMSNVAELDYIANSCGLNINDQEIVRTVKLWKVLNFGYLDGFKDPSHLAIVDNIRMNTFSSMGQFFNQQLNNLFGVF